MPLQKTKHVYMYTQYRKHQHDYKKKKPKIEARISEKADRVGIDGELKIPD